MCVYVCVGVCLWVDLCVGVFVCLCLFECVCASVCDMSLCVGVVFFSLFYFGESVLSKIFFAQFSNSYYLEICHCRPTKWRSMQKKRSNWKTSKRVPIFT